MRKQTNESLRPYTIEEVFELCDALMEGNHKEICKELGDVMEHVVFYAMLGEENWSKIVSTTPRLFNRYFCSDE